MIERILSKAQGRGVLALVREREELVRIANEQVAEINAALAEQAETFRAAFGLPAGEYQFTGDAREIKLVGIEEAVLAAQREAVRAEIAEEDEAVAETA